MSKYHNIKTECDGYTFDSKAEARRYQELVLLERAGEITDLVLQPKYPLTVNGRKVGTYIGDFLYNDQNGKVVLEDVKGIATAVYRLKKKLVAALYGGLEITEIK